LRVVFLYIVKVHQSRIIDGWWPGKHFIKTKLFGRQGSFKLETTDLEFQIIENPVQYNIIR